MKLNIKTCKNKQFRVYLVATNGRVLMASERYQDKRNARNVCDLINQGRDVPFQVMEDGKYGTAGGSGWRGLVPVVRGRG